VAGFVLEPYSTLPVQTWTTNDNSAPVGNLS
jgi:hypothetical protein